MKKIKQKPISSLLVRDRNTAVQYKYNCTSKEAWQWRMGKIAFDKDGLLLPTKRLNIG